MQIERDRVTACRRARDANDFLAREIQARPDRYSGFAHLPMQDPIAAAAELERCVQDLGFCGAMINGHTSGVYVDDPMIDPFWARVETLGVPIYFGAEVDLIAYLLSRYFGMRAFGEIYGYLFAPSCWVQAPGLSRWASRTM